MFFVVLFLFLYSHRICLGEQKFSLLDQTQSGFAILFLAPVLVSVLPNRSKNLAKSVFSEPPHSISDHTLISNQVPHPPPSRQVISDPPGLPLVRILLSWFNQSPLLPLMFPFSHFPFTYFIHPTPWR